MSQVRILIVEDEILVAQDFAARLTEAGYDIVGLASSVKEAQDFIDSHKIDIALLDIMLDEGGTGIEVAKYLNAHQPVPFIFITSLVDSQTVEKAKEVSPSAYLVKPFVSRELHIAIEIALDITRHDRFGIDKDTRTVDATDPLANQRAIHKYPGKIATRIGQSGHSKQFVTQRLPDIRPILNGIVEGQIA